MHASACYEQHARTSKARKGQCSLLVLFFFSLFIYMKLLLLLLIILFIWFTFYNKQIEGAGFALDGLYIPQNPERLNEINIRSRYRVVGIDKYVKLDKFDRVDKILYSKPQPDKGETRCYRVNCPNWLETVGCWKCE